MARGFSVIFTSLMFTVMILTAGGAAAQATYTLNVTTDSSSYTASQTIYITGSVSPAPGPSTAVTLKLINPAGTVLGAWEAYVGATSGLFNYTLVTGGSPGWIAGTYTVNATWGAYPPQKYAKATFTYSPTSTTTTATTTTTTTTSTTPSTTSTSTTYTTTTTTTTTTSTTTTSTTSSTTTTSSSSGGGGIPEFPFQAVSAGVLVALIAAGYLLLRRSTLSARRLVSNL